MSTASTIVPSVVTGAVAVAGLISTGWQAGRAHRAQGSAARRAERLELYGRCLATISANITARIMLSSALRSGALDEHKAAMREAAGQSAALIAITEEMNILAPEISPFSGAVVLAVTNLDDFERSMPVLTHALRVLSCAMRDDLTGQWPCVNS